MPSNLENINMFPVNNTKFGIKKLKEGIRWKRKLGSWKQPLSYS